MAGPRSDFRYYGPKTVSSPGSERFMFATGIECSYPSIGAGPDRIRRDQMQECGHYARWREDLTLAVETGCRYLRYGPPYYRMHVGPGAYDWTFSDEVLPAMRGMGLVPILDLCHFGVPDWLGDFQNPEFPCFFAEYAKAFAQRYPWIRMYTPVNEMYITAEFSGYYGWWNERLTTHEGFVTALKHVTRANLEAMAAIVSIRPGALFVLCESSEHTHANHPSLADQAVFYNDRRFLTLDLTCGRRVNAGMYAYLLDHGMTEDEFAFFMKQDFREHCVVGHDYYAANEHLLVEDEIREGSGDVLGYYALARQYHDRYHLPIMHTETNLHDPEAVDWLWGTWATIQQLRQDGVPICGMTWYSLTDQIDWDTALREKNDRINPLGLYDLDRKIRPVGREYRKLIEQWGATPLLPNGPVGLTVFLRGEDGS
jgi:beta-glucosidase/6-phospho-beta-glucosidase/beta-galactosidase